MAVPARVARVPPVAAVAVALIVLQLAVRAVLAFGGYFYWDDLILVGRAGTQGLLSPSYLFDDHDGHVMPAAFLVAGVITRLAPLVWTWPAVSLVILQLLVSLSLLRALQVILGWRPVLLIPLTFALFTPLGVPGFAWWAAALNSLPMLAAHGVGVRRRNPVAAHGQSPVRGDRRAGVLRWPAVLREGRRHPVRGVRGGRACCGMCAASRCARCGVPVCACGCRCWH